MQYLGLLTEVLFLALGVYLYLFARGIVNIKDPERAARAETFRADNATWMRLLGLALATIMLLNLLVRLKA